VTLGKVQGRVVRHLEEGFRDRIHPAAASGFSGRRHRAELKRYFLALRLSQIEPIFAAETQRLLVDVGSLETFAGPRNSLAKDVRRPTQWQCSETSRRRRRFHSTSIAAALAFRCRGRLVPRGLLAGA